MKLSHQKLKMLYLMKILLEKTDEQHSMTVPEMITELSRLGISAERRSIYDDRVLSEQPFDLSAYAKTMFQMFGGDEVSVSLKFENELVGVIYDRFGVDVPITAPTISAKEYKVIDYKDALAPATKTIDVNQTQTQLGYSVTVQKN